VRYTFKHNGFSLDQLEAAGNSIVSELVKRVDEAEDAKDRALKSYDEMAEASDRRETQIRILREGCNKAMEILRKSRTERRPTIDTLLDALDRAEALEEEEV